MNGRQEETNWETVVDEEKRVDGSDYAKDTGRVKRDKHTPSHHLPAAALDCAASSDNLPG